MPPKEDISKILDIQSKAYNEATTLLFSSLTKRLDDQYKLINDLRVSLEYTQAELKDTKDTNNLLKSDLLDCKKKMENYLGTISNMQLKLDSLEDYSRRNNIKINGIDEEPGENNEILEVKVKKLFTDKLGVDGITINSIHRLPNKQSNDTRHSSPRTIIAQFSSIKERDRTMRNTWKLKDSNIYINDDVCENTAKTRKNLIPQLKDAKAAGKIAFFQGNKLIIRDRKRNVVSNAGRGGRDFTPSPHRRNVSDLVNVFTPAVSSQTISASPPPSPRIQDRQGLRSQSSRTDIVNREEI